jgi:hypothetical protein
LPVRVAGVVLSAVVAPTLLGGCSDEVDVPATRTTTAEAASCRALLDALPAKVAEQSRRPTTGNKFAAAWGDPAIVLRCGVGVPRGYDKFAACQRANGVDWFVPESVISDQRADVVMTTIGRSPRVEVTVPAPYRPSLAPMTDLAEAIKQNTREIAPCT